MKPTICLYLAKVLSADPALIRYVTTEDGTEKAYATLSPQHTYLLDYVPERAHLSSTSSKVARLNHQAIWTLSTPNAADPPASSGDDNAHLTHFSAVSRITLVELQLSVDVDVGEASTTQLMRTRAIERMQALTTDLFFIDVHQQLFSPFPLASCADDSFSRLKIKYDNQHGTLFATFRKIFRIITKFRYAQDGPANHACRGGVMFARWPGSQSLVVAMCFGHCDRAWEMSCGGSEYGLRWRADIALMLRIPDPEDMTIIELFSSADVEFEKKLVRIQHNATAPDSHKSDELGTIDVLCRSCFDELGVKAPKVSAFLLLNAATPPTPPVPIISCQGSTSGKGGKGRGRGRGAGGGGGDSRSTFRTHMEGAPGASPGSTSGNTTWFRYFMLGKVAKSACRSKKKQVAESNFSATGVLENLLALLNLHAPHAEHSSHSQFDALIRCLFGSPAAYGEGSEIDCTRKLVQLLPWNARLDLYAAQDHPGRLSYALRHLGLGDLTQAVQVARVLARPGDTPSKEKAESLAQQFQKGTKLDDDIGKTVYRLWPWPRERS